MSTAYHVAQLLAAQGVGVFAAETGWSINVGTEPDMPENCVTVYDTGGLDPDTEQMDRRPTFQMRARAVDYLTGWGKLNTARHYLLGAGPLTYSGVRYASFEMVGDIVSLGRDDNNRHIFTLNARVTNAEG